MRERKLMHVKKVKSYEKLPLIYDYLMRKISYKIWAEYIATIVDEYVSSGKKALELAAGSCKLANYMMSFYPEIYATDLSVSMLKSDFRKYVPKICCDMTALPFKTKFGLIYSTFDSINYLTSKSKVLNLFKEISKVLDDDGVFTFDVSLEKNSINHSRVPERKGTFEGIEFRQQSTYDMKRRIHFNSFKLEMKNDIILYENHKQKIYPFETYFELLEKAGLFAVKCFKAFSFKDGDANSERVQFIVKKRRTKC